MPTPVYRLPFPETENELYVKRDDLYPLSFGGNKARKAELFWQDLEAKKSDHVVTYGTSSSNHCRVIANLAAMHGLPCTIISPEQKSEETFNSDLMRLFGAKIIVTPVDHVKVTIDETMEALRQQGYTPYFIMGGGHGNMGTQAYVNTYEEILALKKRPGLSLIIFSMRPVPEPPRRDWCADSFFMETWNEELPESALPGRSLMEEMWSCRV